MTNHYRHLAKSLPRLGIAVIAALGAAACGSRAENERTSDVRLTTSDGVALAATLYKTSTPSPPCLILLHQLGSSKEEWLNFATLAQQSGMMCLAIDLRGHGDSKKQGTNTLAYRNFTTNDWLNVANDIDAAREALLAHGADPKNLAVIGSSIGGNLALNYAVDHKDIQAIVMISPGLDYHGVATENPIRHIGKQPILLLTTTGDAYSNSSCARLKDIAAGFCELREYPGSVHGVGILDASQSAREQVLLWLSQIIGPKGLFSDSASNQNRSTP